MDIDKSVLVEFVEPRIKPTIQASGGRPTRVNHLPYYTDKAEA